MKKKLTKSKEDEIKDKIGYWSKHQELDKFNYNRVTSTQLSVISILGALWIGIVALSIVGRWINGIYFISIIVIVVLIPTTIFYVIRTKSSNNHFRIREAMIRNWYHSIGVDTLKIDKDFTKIMEKLKEEPRMKNDELNRLARKSMKNDR